MEFRESSKEKTLFLIDDLVDLISTQNSAIEELKSENEALRFNLEKFRIFYEEAPDAFYIHDTNGVIVACNKNVEKISGFSRDEIIGKNIFQIGIIPDSQAEKSIERLKLVNEEIIPGPEEFVVFNKSGQSVDVEVTNIPVSINNNTYVLGIARDISHRKPKKNSSLNSHEKSDKILEAIPDIVILVNRQGDYLDFKPDLLNIRQLRPEDVIGKNIRDFHFSDESINHMLYHVNRAADTGEPQTLQYDYQAPSGTVTYECRLVPINNKEVMGVVRDVTENKNAFNELKIYRDQLEEAIENRTEELTRANLKLHEEIFEREKAENELRFKEYLLRAMSDTSPLAFCITDENNEDILYFNHRFCEIWKIEFAEERMRRRKIKVSELFNLCLPIVSDIPAFVGSIKSFLDVNNREILQDTIEFINGKSIRRFSAQIRTDDDTLLGRLIMCEDITDRVKSTEALRQSEARLRAILDNIPFLAWFKDLNSKYIAVNKHYADRFGLSQDEFAGKTDYDIWDADSADKFISDDLEVILTKSQKNLEEFVTLNNNSTWLETFKTPIIDDLGNTIGTTGLSKDITERKLDEERKKELIEELKKNKLKMEDDASRLHALNSQLVDAEEELRQVISSKDKFFSIIAHDLKDAFAGSLSLAELLELKSSQMEKGHVEKVASGINTSLKHLYSLLSNLLEWSRAQMGKMEFTPSKNNIRNLVEKNINVLDASAKRKSIEVVNNIPRDLFALIDANMMNTVVHNLLTNALKYCRHDGLVSFDVNDVKDGFVFISVTDNGIGMDEEAMDKIFRIDTKYSLPGTDNEKGTGLGLVLCKELIEKHGGSIQVESQPGQGCTFTFNIPV